MQLLHLEEESKKKKIRGRIDKGLWNKQLRQRD
jgi:hypothetical protein